MWRHSLFAKGSMVFGLFLLLTIPILTIQGQIADRKYTGMAVAEDIARSYSKKQVVVGPIIYIPYKERTWDRRWNKELEKYERVAKFTSRKLVLFPQTLSINSKVETEIRYRGIYGAPVYQSGNDISGEFVLPKSLPFKGKDIVVESAYLLMAVNDMRGIRRVPEVQLNGLAPVRMNFGADIADLDDRTLYVDLGRADAIAGQSLPFSLTLALNGTSRLGFIPAAGDTEVQMQSSWPHPGFNGLMLPEKHTISENGFSASWFTNQLAATAAVSCIEEVIHCDDEALALNVDFVEPVTGYLSTERAVKYGYLFILLTFASFLLFEVMKKIRIHGVQYLLVGMALAMFYLLLLALSEHISFGVSYLIAASCCVGLIGYYLRYVLRSGKSSLLFCSALSLVYGVLYMALLSEDYALLMGATLLFMVLAGIMAATKGVDWYGYSEALSKTELPPTAQVEGA